jgi:hypothetical protein
MATAKVRATTVKVVLSLCVLCLRAATAQTAVALASKVRRASSRVKALAVDKVKKAISKVRAADLAAISRRMAAVISMVKAKGAADNKVRNAQPALALARRAMLVKMVLCR